ncbi:hypothetical protein [Vagococcus xieshaowenii]|uniref:WxL domain-containing protein n=1 Tax=Vagococcus xieshaowenii TaxID=2562451 RepID=A0AAJ5JME8_9ENTE|nr:hypothetical protein [Vagococcus xieshaowenii]QCA29432.1 hypothetical protein E4Z98_08925 [Vagococcus xieshaowenii]TFZ41552.1 hypothetical protein E4031_05000 [Vagococcus xieshaowenii]
MKKISLFLLTPILLGLSLATKVEAQSVDAIEHSQATVSIGPGNISLDNIDLTLDFGKDKAIYIEDSNQVRKKEGTISILDTRSGNNGWHVQVKRQDKATNKWHKALNLSLQEATQEKQLINSVGFVNMLNQEDGVSYDALQNRPVIATLEIGKEIPKGEYSTTLVWNLQAGPEN